MTDREKQLDLMLENSLVDINDEVQEEAKCIRVKNNNWGTLSNFSCVIGKAKAKKSFLITAVLAAAVSRHSQGITVDLPKGANLILHFDTEQSFNHVLVAMKRVWKLADQFPMDLFPYRLRKHSPEERLEMIERALKKHEGEVGLVIIDGVKDLIKSINDEDQATMIVTKLMQWTDQYNIHIVVVLHQNKGDLNARGHVGTEITNKAETVISVTQDKDNKEVAIVKCEYSRDREFEPFAFSINEDGVPTVLDDFKVIDLSVKKKVELTWDQVKEILAGAFTQPEMQYAQLITSIQKAMKSYGIASTGKSAAGALKKRGDDLGVIVKASNDKGYPVYKMKNIL